MTLGEKIYQLRKQKGYSQEELAEKLNISRQSVSLWENNQTVPSIDCLIELSKLFGVTLDEICGNNIDDNDKKILEDSLSETTFEFTEKKARKLIKILQSTRRALLIVGVNLILIGIMILAKNQFIPFLILDIFVNIFIIGMRSNNKFSAFLCFGIGAIISIQTILNIAVVSGSIPPTGLPLPFISAGSTSLLVFK